MTYAAVSVTEFYGPETRYQILSLHDDLGDAKVAADAHAPDFDAKVDAHRLAHNQSSPTRGEVMQIITFGYDEREADYYEENGFVVACDEQGDTYVLGAIED